MALKKVSFNRGQGGLGRPLAGEDHYSGLVLYADTLPSGFGSSDREKLITSLEDAENLGIVDDYSDETVAEGEYQVTNAGAVGNTVTVKVTEYKQLLSTGEYNNKVVTLCSFTAATADVASVNAMAAKIGAKINLGTSTHGYSATVSTDTVTIAARQGMGESLNSGTPLSVTIVGTVAGTITQFTGGVGSELAVFHYHISEIFRKQPKCILYTGIYADTSKTIGADLVTLQTFAEGKIRQAMIYQSTTAFSSAHCTTIQSYCTTLAGLNMPISTVVYAAKIDAVSDLTGLADLKALTAKNVVVAIAQDMQGKGWELYNATGNSITDAGARLGTIALADVASDISNPENFNFSNGVELERIGFANGDYVTDVSTNTLDLLDDYGYQFLRKFVGFAGSYSNSSRTAINTTSDYAYIESNRTIDKAIRNLYITYTPKLSSKITLNANGTILDETVSYYESLGEMALDQMVRDIELSAKEVNIDPNQNVLSTSTLVVAVKLVPIGIAKEITVNIGYALSL